MDTIYVALGRYRNETYCKEDVRLAIKPIFLMFIHSMPFTVVEIAA